MCQTLKIVNNKNHIRDFPKRWNIREVETVPRSPWWLSAILPVAAWPAGPSHVTHSVVSRLDKNMSILYLQKMQEEKVQNFLEKSLEEKMFLQKPEPLEIHIITAR